MTTESTTIPQPLKLTPSAARLVPVGLTPRRLPTDYLVVHCSANTANTTVDAAAIDKMHRQKGWTMIGYAYVIKQDGTVQVGRHEDAIGAHVENYNARSVGVCLIGGLDKNLKPKNTFTPEQLNSLRVLLQHWQEKYPTAHILGHRDFPNVAKACPSFDVAKWLPSVGIVNQPCPTF